MDNKNNQVFNSSGASSTLTKEQEAAQVQELLNSIQNIQEKPSEQAEVESVLKELNKVEEAQYLPETTPNTNEPSWVDDALMSARMIQKGIFAGYDSKIVAAIQAGKDYVLKGADYGESYDNYKKAFIQENEEFKERNPIAATGLEMAGAIAPFSKATKATSMLGEAATKNWMTSLGVAGATGAASSAGNAGEEDNVLLESLYGGTAGVVFQGGLQGTGWLLKGLVSPKTSMPLDSVDPRTGKEIFTPITLSDVNKNGIIHQLYRDVVGSGFGGATKIIKQEEAILDPIEASLKRLDSTLSSAKKQASEKFVMAKKKVENLKQAKVDDIESSLEDLGAGKRVSNLGITENLKIAKDKAASQAVLEFDNAVEKQLAAFRLKAFESSMPEALDEAGREAIRSANTPQQALLRLNKAWSEQGFSTLKNNSYDIKSTDFMALVDDVPVSKLGDKILADPIYAGMDDRVLKRTLETVASTLKENSKEGGVSGEVLAGIRTTVSNISSNLEGREQLAVREVLNELNSQIRKQLPRDQLPKFDKELLNWKTNIILRDSVLRASNKAGREGAFSPDNWLASVKSNSKKDAMTGTGILSKEANTVGKFLEKRNEVLKESTDVLLDKLSKKAVVGKTKVIKEVSEEIKKLKKEKESLAKTSKDKISYLAQREKNDLKVKELESQRDKLIAGVKELESRAVSKDAGIFRRLAATEQVSASTDSSFLRSATGTLVGSALAAPNVQRAVVGQTPLQRNLFELGQKASQASSPIKSIMPSMSGLLGSQIQQEY